MKNRLKVLLAFSLLFLFSVGLFAQSGLSNGGAYYNNGSGKDPEYREVCTTSTVWVWVYATIVPVPVPVSVETCEMVCAYNCH